MCNKCIPLFYVYISIRYKHNIKESYKHNIKDFYKHNQICKPIIRKVYFKKECI